MSFKTIAGRHEGVFWWFPALSEDQEKICRIHQNYLVVLRDSRYDPFSNVQGDIYFYPTRLTTLIKSILCQGVVLVSFREVCISDYEKEPNCS